MMNKFLEWCDRNSKTISYTIGGLNLLAGLSSLIAGNYSLAIVGLTIGVFLVFDARRGVK